MHVLLGRVSYISIQLCKSINTDKAVHIIFLVQTLSMG